MQRGPICVARSFKGKAEGFTLRIGGANLRKQTPTQQHNWSVGKPIGISSEFQNKPILHGGVPGVSGLANTVFMGLISISFKLAFSNL